MDYPNAKFLIYSCWEKDLPYKIAGSLLLADAFTEEEAKEMIKVYKIRHDEFEAKFPCTYPSRTRFTYITNSPEWWAGRKAHLSSPLALAVRPPLASQ
jgi:hypothetical protein